MAHANHCGVIHDVTLNRSTVTVIQVEARDRMARLSASSNTTLSKGLTRYSYIGTAHAWARRGSNSRGTRCHRDGSIRRSGPTPWPWNVHLFISGVRTFGQGRRADPLHQTFHH